MRVYYLHDGNPDIEARLMFKDHDGRMGATSCARERNGLTPAPVRSRLILVHMGGV